MDAETNTPPAQVAPANSGETPTTFSPEYVEGLRKEAAKWRTALREKEAELAAAKVTPAASPDDLLALKTEVEQLKAAQVQRDEAIKAKDLELMKQRIAGELGLTPKLAARLQGADEDSIRADAQALAEELPKPAAGRLTPGATAGVPNGQAQGVTRDQLLQKMYGRKRHSFSAPASDAGADGETPKVFRRGG
jgi:capsid protein